MQDKYSYEHSGPRYVHREIAKIVLGKELTKGIEVHHVDENCKNNIHSNLVVCQNRGYHILLHLRTNGLKACGNVNARKCYYCKEWKDKSEFNKHWKDRDTVEICKTCAQTESKIRRERNKDQIKQQTLKYYTENKDKIKVKQASYYQEHKEEINKRRRMKRKSNHEE